MGHAGALRGTGDGRDDRQRPTFDGVTVGHFRHAETPDFPRITYDHAPGVDTGRALTVFLQTITVWAWESAR